MTLSCTGLRVKGRASLISWSSSLSYNDYRNNVSRITDNLLRGFLPEGPLPGSGAFR